MERMHITSSTSLTVKLRRICRVCGRWALLVAFGVGLLAMGGVKPAGVSAADAQPAPFDPLASISAALGSPAQITARVESGGPTDTLVVTATLEDGWHLYSLEQKPGGPQPTRIVLAADAPLKLAGPFRPDEPPHRRTIKDVPGWNGLVVEEHAGTVIWRAPLARNPAGQAPDLNGTVSLQLCRDNACTPPETIPFSARVAGAASAAAAAVATDPAATPPPAAPSRGGETDPQPAVAPLRQSTPSVEAVPPPVVAEFTGSRESVPVSLPTALLMGLIGGMILNLMPCVLPVLGLKLMSFAQQSGRARQEIFQLNLWYCAGLYAVFFVLATASVAANLGLAGSNLAWGEQFTSSRFNIAMAAIVFAFALSFLGVWELPIPGFIGDRAGKVQSQEGPSASFLKGVLSTVLATPCSGPFLGPVFGFTLTQTTGVTYAVFGAIATGMALPYLLVGLFPGLVKFMPKPGAWMETLKELLGFVMLGTVVFLFTFLDHDWFVPTFALLIGIWAACWWIGRAQHAQAGEIGFGRWLQAAGIVSTVGTLAFMFLGPVASVIPWEPFSRERLADLRQKGATVLVDFSADWCMTCKYNLATAIETTKVKAEIERNRVVPLLADWTDGSPEIKQMLASLQSKSIPVLAVFPAARSGDRPPEPIVLRDLVTESQVLSAIREAGPSRAAPTEIRAASKPLTAAGHER
jgi:thiol:disulfide interchange protein